MIRRSSIWKRRNKGTKLCRIFEIPFDSRLVGKFGTTGKRCSCCFCGNPRRHFKGEERLTVQERKSIMAARERKEKR